MAEIDAYPLSCFWDLRGPYLKASTPKQTHFDVLRLPLASEYRNLSDDMQNAL